MPVNKNKYIALKNDTYDFNELRNSRVFKDATNAFLAMPLQQ